MRLITDAKTLENTFIKLQQKYNEYYWLSAWAGVGSHPYNILIENECKIRKILVGIHFYQTHPDFIESLIENDSVRYIMQPNGTYHPKLFLFYNSDNEWELLVGSANFTNAAFTTNFEITTLISHKEKDSDKLLTKVFQTINSAWTDGVKFKSEDLLNYRNAWKTQSQKTQSLSGDYGNKNTKRQGKSIPIHLVPVANMTWDEFMNKVKNEKYHSLNRRLKVLSIARTLYASVNSFKELSPDERKFIAGIPNKLKVDKDVDWGYFGSMRGAGWYKKKIADNDEVISNALDEIPLTGQITKKHYSNFVSLYKTVFEGNFLGTASRLLAMKRPDVFVCLDSKNKAALCKDFGIVQKDLGYERYWDDIIKRIYDSIWWESPSPKGDIEKQVSKSRAAFLDSIYFEE